MEYIVPFLTVAIAVWYIFVGVLNLRKGNETHGLMYQLCAVLIFVMTALAVWAKGA